MPAEPLIAWISKRKRVSSSEVADHLGVTRQAAHRRLRALAEQGVIAPTSAGRTAAWEVAASVERHRFNVRGLAEDRVWRDLVETSPLLRKLSTAARRITSYAFTEMLNNALEHSGAKTVTVKLGRKGPRTWFEVEDSGVGAFERIRATRKLASHEDALAELTKGKVTTAPEAHSGEGIFFTSKAVDRFELEANRLAWTVDRTRDDWAVTSSSRRRGTRVRCEIERATTRELDDTFGRYTIDDVFAKSRIVVKLFARGTDFVSRSEARRILVGLEQFREVVFDFRGIDTIGQGFADEVFRVWTQRHPETRLVSANTSRNVEFMLKHVRRGHTTGAAPSGRRSRTQPRATRQK